VPELPEVEVIRQALVPRVVQKKIADVQILEPRLTRRGGTPDKVAAGLRGWTVVALRRRGKFFLFDLDRDTLVVRLGMTGQLLWWDTEPGFQPDPHTHATLRFAGGGVLSYRDVRKFGEMFLLPTAEVESTLRIGLEPLDPTFTVQKLGEMCEGSRLRIKALLLNQRKIAGIGNIYADEALFRAGLRPTRRASTLRQEEIHALRRSIRSVLRAGIQHGGSSISDFRHPSGESGEFATLHRVYHRDGQRCVRCEATIRRIVLGQRGTHFCPSCQR
jgi:formamidopyrimidine-DNA glycosylase